MEKMTKMTNDEVIEKCAKIADEWKGREPDDLDLAEEIAFRIREQARTPEPPITNGQA